jgi:hypothetical protein
VLPAFMRVLAFSLAIHTQTLFHRSSQIDCTGFSLHFRVCSSLC